MKREVRLRVTADRIAKFEEAIDMTNAVGPSADVDPLIWRAQIAGMESMLSSLRSEYSELLAGSA